MPKLSIFLLIFWIMLPVFYFWIHFGCWLRLEAFRTVLHFLLLVCRQVRQCICEVNDRAP